MEDRRRVKVGIGLAPPIYQTKSHQLASYERRLSDLRPCAVLDAIPESFCRPKNVVTMVTI